MAGGTTAAAETIERLLTGGPHLSVGMLTANLLELGLDMTMLAANGAEIVHIDVMDGVFCPQITFGPPVVKAIRTPLIKDVHLMIDDPLSKVESFVQAGADMITFHLEGARQPHRVLHSLGGAVNANDPARGVIRGVGLNPSTSVDAIEPLLEEVDYVLITSIDPGWGGQSFLSSTERRLDRAHDLIARSGRRILLGVDGGVTKANIGQIAALGTDIVVSGSAIFDGGDVQGNLATMLGATRETGR